MSATSHDNKAVTHYPQDEPVAIHIRPDENGEFIVRAGNRGEIFLGTAEWLVETVVSAVLGGRVTRPPVPEWAKEAGQAFQSTR
ncbi:hypothetical protein [Pseudochrobactrum sp. HB0163]|uniref:hypothetical protein n=1 Tax=Pseudochrobactrum sp. HB0163 TaxID=3450708 RepID=UPI003F6DDDCF